MSERERKVKELRELGLSNEAIAKRLGISTTTVGRIIAKLGLPAASPGRKPIDGKTRKPKKNGDSK